MEYGGCVWDESSGEEQLLADNLGSGRWFVLSCYQEVTGAHEDIR